MVYTVPEPEGRSPEGEGLYKPYSTWLPCYIYYISVGRDNGVGSDALALAIACNNPAFIATALQNRAVSIALGGCYNKNTVTPSQVCIDFITLLLPRIQGQSGYIYIYIHVVCTTMDLRYAQFLKFQKAVPLDTSRGQKRQEAIHNQVSTSFESKQVLQVDNAWCHC